MTSEAPEGRFSTIASLSAAFANDPVSGCLHELQLLADGPNTGEFPRNHPAAALKPPQTLANFRAQRPHSDASERRWPRFKPPQRSPQKRDRARSIAALQVMKRSRHLNQRLHKALLRLLQAQPDALPMLVGKKEFPAAIARETLRKRSAAPIERQDSTVRNSPILGDSRQPDQRSGMEGSTGSGSGAVYTKQKHRSVSGSTPDDMALFAIAEHNNGGSRCAETLAGMRIFQISYPDLRLIACGIS